MYRKMTLVTIAVIALSGMLWAEDMSLEARAEKQGALRARILSKMNELAKLTDNGQNGVSAAYQALEYNWQQTRSELNKRINTEAAKQGDAKDAALIDSLVAKSQKLDKLWAEHMQEWQTYTRISGEPLGSYQSMAQVYQYISSVDQAWLRAGLDPDALTATLAAMDKRVDEIKATVARNVADVKKACDQRLQQIKE